MKHFLVELMLLVALHEGTCPLKPTTSHSVCTLAFLPYDVGIGNGTLTEEQKQHEEEQEWH